MHFKQAGVGSLNMNFHDLSSQSDKLCMKSSIKGTRDPSTEALSGQEKKKKD